jgi:hypothetical protein
METALKPMDTSPDDLMLLRALPPVAIPVESSAKATCRALLAHAEYATDLLLHTPIDSRLIPGRWSATLQGAEDCVQYELVQGPMRGLALSLRADDTGGGSAVLQIEGSYMAPLRPLLARRRAQQLAEALRHGLARRLQDDLAPGAGWRIEQRATPRQVIALPVRFRVGDSPWPGVTRNVSAGGLGLLIPTMPEYAVAAAAQIFTHGAGTVEMLVGEGRLTSGVRITRAKPWGTGIDVGLCYDMPEEGARLQRRLAALNLWREPAHAPSR